MTVKMPPTKCGRSTGVLKYNGLAINGQYYLRWLDDFEADGPLPLTSTFDHGWEMSVGKFVVPKKVMVYGRGSAIWESSRTRTSMEQASNGISCRPSVSG